ncbi:MAG: NAD-dependent epimerase/dehydratase family protein [Chitinophagaceae bacterium]
MKVLLTGATGFLGFRTLERLSTNPLVEKIVATGRNIKPTHFFEHKKVEYQLGDLTDFHFVRNLVSQADLIIHAAALSSPWGRYHDFESANVHTQKNLIIAAQESGIKRYIFISSPSIYFDATDRLNIKETDPLPEKFINSYAATKWMAEKELVQSQLPYIILRPRALIGRGDTVIMPRMIHAFRDGKLKIIGDGKNIVDLTSVANMTQAIERSMLVDECGLNQSYNITNGEPVRLWDSIEQILNLLGYHFLPKKVPFTVVNMLAKWMEWKSKMTNFKEPVLTVYGVGTLARSFTMDITKARTLLDYKPELTTGEAMKEFADWYVDLL